MEEGAVREESRLNWVEHWRRALNTLQPEGSLLEQGQRMTAETVESWQVEVHRTLRELAELADRIATVWMAERERSH
ncbi:protein of unknown function [Candidatus Hydrogenisulfobacillus filiaventi]|uniref:Uncharacterized protein n=1 Tax=Candidatus Hydrogenisulfobacillus filiaventi TaxID=2707344 RepID=A0A6F8ZFX6_9FIRM|nr:protein of unknown function [Candidatus Hydrogenisulfobacillus filiaventi]